MALFLRYYVPYKSFMSGFFLSIENSWWQPPQDKVLTYQVGPYGKIDDFLCGMKKMNTC